MTTTDPDQRPGGASPGLPGVPVPTGLPVLPRPGEEFGFTVTRTAVLACAGVAVDRVLRLPPDRAWAVLCVLTLVALTPAARAATAATGAVLVWLVGTGFETHRSGETTFDGGDRGHLAVVALAACVAWVVSRRAASARRAERGE